MRCKACDAFINTVNEELCSDCLEVIRLGEKGIEPNYKTKEDWIKDLEIETGIEVYVDKDV